MSPERPPQQVASGVHVARLHLASLHWVSFRDGATGAAMAVPVFEGVARILTYKHVATSS